MLRKAVLFGLLLLPAFGSVRAPFEEATVVVAVQAFLDETSETEILKIWRDAPAALELDAAFARGAVPHITFGSWEIPRSRLDSVRKRFRKRKREFETVGASLTLDRWGPYRGKYGFAYLVNETPVLLALHETVHRKLNLVYRPYRPQDLPGQWEPHLALFTIPEAAREEHAELLRRVAGRCENIRSVSITRFGLVAFDDGVQLLEVIPCKKSTMRKR